MDFKEIFGNKSTKAKEKIAFISEQLLQDPSLAAPLILFARTAKDADKGSCIEALEFATKKDPTIATKEMLELVTHGLAEKAPRIKWESAKVVGNIANHLPAKPDKAIGHLLTNTEHSGAVVRWAAAYALGEIVQTKYGTKELAAAMKTISDREEKNSIKKIYAAALKKVTARSAQ